MPWSAALAQVSAAAPGFPAVNPDIAGEKAVLDVWLSLDLAGEPAYHAAIDAFQRTYRGLTVRLTPVVFADVPDKLKIAAQGGRVPDLVSHHAYILGAQGLAKESDLLWSDWGQERSFLPGAMDDVYWRGDKYGVPLGLTTTFVIYNRDMFARARIPVPDDRTTFDGLTRALTRVKAANRLRWAVALSRGGDIAAAVVHANGGELMRLVHSHNKAQLTAPAAVEALRWYTELGWKQRLGAVPPRSAAASDYPRTLFIAGQVSLFFGSSQDLALIGRAAPLLRVGTAQMPAGMRGRTHGSVLGGVSLFVPQGSRRSHAAFELAKWLVADPVALPTARSLGLAPVLRAQYQDPYFSRASLLAPYFRQVQTARPTGLDAYAEGYRLFLSALNGALDGAEMASLLPATQRQVQAAMDRADAGIDADG